MALVTIGDVLRARDQDGAIASYDEGIDIARSLVAKEPSKRSGAATWRRSRRLASFRWIVVNLLRVGRSSEQDVAHAQLLPTSNPLAHGLTASLANVASR